MQVDKVPESMSVKLRWACQQTCKIGPLSQFILGALDFQLPIGRVTDDEIDHVMSHLNRVFVKGDTAVSDKEMPYLYLYDFKLVNNLALENDWVMTWVMKIRFERGIYLFFLFWKSK